MCEFDLNWKGMKFLTWYQNNMCSHILTLINLLNFTLMKMKLFSKIPHPSCLREMTGSEFLNLMPLYVQWCRKPSKSRGWGKTVLYTSQVCSEGGDHMSPLPTLPPPFRHPYVSVVGAFIVPNGECCWLTIGMPSEMPTDTAKALSLGSLGTLFTACGLFPYKGQPVQEHGLYTWAMGALGTNTHILFLYQWSMKNR